MKLLNQSYNNNMIKVYDMIHLIWYDAKWYDMIWFNILLHTCMINNVFNFLDYSNTDGPHSLIVLTGAIQVTMDDGGELFSLTSGLEGFLHESDGPDDGQARCAKCGSKEAADCPMASKTMCRWCHIVHMLVYGEVTWKDPVANPLE